MTCGVLIMAYGTPSSREGVEAYYTRIRHGSPPTQIRIAHAADAATITVWDAGPGLPPTEFENVFRPFYRPANSRNPSGSGLGLALVRQIARRHGGDAICSTLADGRTGFVVTLPT